MNIGLLCSKTFDDAIFEELLEAKYGLQRAQIKKMNIKGKLQIWTHDDGYHEVPLKECHQWTREGCKMCPDFAAEHADISTGGIGKFNDWTLTIVRTDAGRDLMERMLADGAIEVRPGDDDPDAIALMHKLSAKSRKRWPEFAIPAPASCRTPTIPARRGTSATRCAGKPGRQSVRSVPRCAVANMRRSESHLRPRLSDRRREALRTNLWVVPAIELVAAAALFVVTYALDRAAYRGSLTFPGWVNNGSADAARQILTGIAAAVITVVGLVFSILIVALTLASTQFGPRMLRNFIRDRGVQITLGTFVATFFYAVLTLGSVSHGSPATSSRTCRSPSRSR